MPVGGDAQKTDFAIQNLSLESSITLTFLKISGLRPNENFKQSFFSYKL